MGDTYPGDRPVQTGHALVVTVRVSGDVQIVSVSGRMDSVTADTFDARLQPIVAVANPRVILDLAQVSYVSSAGLRSLLMLGKQIKAGSGALVLAGVQPRVCDVLEIAGFTATFAIAASTDAALASLQAAR